MVNIILGVILIGETALILSEIRNTNYDLEMINHNINAIFKLLEELKK